MKTIEVPTEDLVCDPKCQARADVQYERVQEYQEHYASGVKLPPLDVFVVLGRYHVVDGFHRHPAAEKAGLSSLPCRVVGEGSIDDAAWYATGANQAHGVRRTNADRRRAVTMALQNPKAAEMTDRAIAEHVGVGHQLVASVRAQVDESSTSTPKPPKSQAPTPAPTGRPNCPRGQFPPWGTKFQQSVKAMPAPTGRPLWNFQSAHGGTITPHAHGAAPRGVALP